MEPFFEGRTSDSPYISMVWRGYNGPNYFPVCPADECWNLLFYQSEGRVRVTVEGPLTKATPKSHRDSAEFLVIKFTLGTFMPNFPVRGLTDTDALLPDATGRSFWLNSSTWQLPSYDNAETFVERLVREEILVVDPLVTAALQDHPVDSSFRTLRRRFLNATGLTQSYLRQLERARQAVSLLEKGTPILDAVYETGYSDQPHLTRSLRHFFDITPAQIARVSQPG
jgi:hypothetical protein